MAWQDSFFKMMGPAQFMSPPAAQMTPGAMAGSMPVDPMQGMGAMERFSYLKQNNPEALMGLAAGMMNGDLGGGFQAAGAEMSAHRKQAQARQEEAQRQNKTKQWLVQQRGLSEEEADMALSNPAILNEYLKSPERQSLMNAGDGQIYDPNSGEWITAPGGVQKAPTVVELFDEATGQPYKATWDQESGTYQRVGGVKARSGMSLRTNPDGSVELMQGDLAGNMPKLTEAEGRNAGFYGRGVESHKVITELEEQGTSLFNKTLGNLPVAGNYLRGPEAQKFAQAQRNYINAVLRRESGAVISPEEFANAQEQYFPQPGDSPEVIEQKRANRETTIRGLEISAGQGAGFATQPPTEGATGGWTDLGNGIRVRQLP